jgi:hypothetical protein
MGVNECSGCLGFYFSSTPALKHDPLVRAQAGVERWILHSLLEPAAGSVANVKSAPLASVLRFAAIELRSNAFRQWCELRNPHRWPSCQWPTDKHAKTNTRMHSNSATNAPNAE